MAKRPIFGITNIPEDIKLELSNGTLTLKSGSIITRPDGNQYIITSDKTITNAGNGTRFVFIRTDNNNIVTYQLTNCVSGITDSLSGQTYHVWFDTANNVINAYTSNTSTPAYTLYLPCCIITGTASVVSSIDQVFNGFGYIGSTRFVLPGVEGYYPDGKDGFKYTFTTTTVNNLLIINTTLKYTNAISNFSRNNISNWSYGLEVVDTLPDVSSMVRYRRYYSKKDNKVYDTSNNITINQNKSIPYAYFSTETSSPYRITSLDIKDEFLVVDLYEYEYASSKPISQYANSESYTGLFNNLCYMFSNTQTISDWYDVVFNLNTAEGYGLDIWGKILNQGRQFSYNNNGTMEYVYLGGEQTIDGITYSAEQMEKTYRLVLFLKALSNISGCTIASLNELLGFYFQDRGRVYVLEYGVMEIRYVFQFYVTKFEKAIFTSSVMPKPTGVLISFEFLPIGDYFGFFVSGLASPTDQPFAPFDNKPFYR